MYYRLEVSPKPEGADPQGVSVLEHGRRFLGLPLKAVHTRKVYSVFADCDRPTAEQIVAAFANSVIEDGVVGETEPPVPFEWVVIVGFRPGVTDNVARSARSAISDILNRKLDDHETAYASTEYFIHGGSRLNRAKVEKLAFDLLANDLIQTTTVLSKSDWQATGAPVNCPTVEQEIPPHVETIDLDLEDDELLKLSRQRTLALTLTEMKAIQAYYREHATEREARGLPAWPTDVELECLAQTWSEHCKHKIFNARISYTDERGETQEIDSCFKTFIRGSTEEIAKRVDWLVSVFHDNAGVIRFNDSLNLVYKVETHNSPTALDPYGGAMTGIVGVNRDPMGTGLGAELLLNVWGYCLASPFTREQDVPEGLFHPRRLRDQVHKGVIDGGNQSGIPYAAGWEYFDKRYLGKPLVYCGTVGTLPHKIGDRQAHEKQIYPGDIAVVIGGRIGKDGIHGATFSSEELHTESPVQAVQIGDPITQKKVSDFLREARDQLLYRFITDNGAGGLSSSIGEMSEICGGCEIELAQAPLKYAGLQPWEILLSEAQERMSLAVPPEDLEAFLELAKRRDVEATVLGTFTDSGSLDVTCNGELVCSIHEKFLHDGLPQMHLKGTWIPPQHPEPELPPDNSAGELLLTVLKRLNICSGEYKARQYDHEVKGLSVIKPYVGAANNVASDATVSMVTQLGREGVILSTGIAPRYSDIDTYHMMTSIIDMAVRRVIAVGGQLGHIAGLDNFCWPDPVTGPNNPDGEYKTAQLVRANQALFDLTTAYGVPCISGKDSMKNDSTLGGRKISIPPTVLFSAIAKMPDIDKAVTLEAKRDGDLVYVIGTTRRELGGSEFYATLDAVGQNVPKVDPAAALALYERVSQATQQELLHSLHTPAMGGLGVGLAKLAVGGHLGLDVDLTHVPVDEPLTLVEKLFSESNSRFLGTIGPHNRQAFESLLDGIPFACIGKVTLDPIVVLRNRDLVVSQLNVDDLLNAYTTTLDKI